MLLTLAMLEGGAIVDAILMLIVMGVIFGLLWWLIGYCAIPQPFAKVANIVLAIAAVVVVINVLLSIVGKPFIRW